LPGRISYGRQHGATADADQVLVAEQVLDHLGERHARIVPPSTLNHRMDVANDDGAPCLRKLDGTLGSGPPRAP
jgi:hypothetical protein